MRTGLSQPCNECPFRRSSAPGWLGPWEPQELLQVISHDPFACHQTIRDDYDSWEPQPEDDDIQMCAGSAIYLNNKFERSRIGFIAEYQNDMKSVSDEIKQSVFNRPNEFVEHHNVPFGSWKTEGQ